MVAAIVAGSAMLISSVGLHRLIPYLRVPEKQVWSFRGTVRELKSTLTDSDLLPLLFATLLIGTSFTAWGALQVYIYSYFFALSTAQLSGLTSIWLLGVVFGFLGTPLVSRGRDKRTMAILMLCCVALAEAIPILLRYLDLFPVPDSAIYYPLVLAFICADMTFFIVLMALLGSMLADVSEKRESVSGQREEGALYSTQSLIGKGSSALGVAISGVILDLIQFPTSTAASEISQEVVNQLGLSVLLIFLFFYPVAMLSIRRFRIGRTEHLSSLKKLKGDHS